MQWSSARTIDLPGHICQLLETCLVVKTGECYALLGAEARDAFYKPVMYTAQDSPTARYYPAPNANCDELRNPMLERALQKQRGENIEEQNGSILDPKREEENIGVYLSFSMHRTFLNNVLESNSSSCLLNTGQRLLDILSVEVLFHILCTVCLEFYPMYVLFLQLRFLLKN